MTEQERDRSVDRLGAHEVVVVEDEHERLARSAASSLISGATTTSTRSGPADRSAASGCASELRPYRAERADHVAPEADGIAVGGVEGQPGERTRLLRRGAPLAEQRRLAPAGRRADERQLALALGDEPREELVSGYELGPERRRVQLGRNQHRLEADEASPCSRRRLHRLIVMRSTPVETRPEEAARGLAQISVAAGRSRGVP